MEPVGWRSDMEMGERAYIADKASTHKALSHMSSAVGVRISQAVFRRHAVKQVQMLKGAWPAGQSKIV